MINLHTKFVRSPIANIWKATQNVQIEVV